MKLGAEPKKVAALGGLVLLAIVTYFVNSSDGPSSPPAASNARPSTPIRMPAQQSVELPTGRPAQVERARASSRQGRTLREFKPSMKPKRPEDRPDPMTVDPTLRTDVLAKLQAVTVVGMHRSLFEFGAAPPPPVAAKGPTVKVGDIMAARRPMGPEPPPPPALPVAPPAPPPPPPIPMKFYGYVTPSRSGAKRAFFLEGEDIHVVNEGDMVKRRYKIIRIGVNSVVVEDTQFKNQQTLPLEEQPG